MKHLHSLVFLFLLLGFGGCHQKAVMQKKPDLQDKQVTQGQPAAAPAPDPQCQQDEADIKSAVRQLYKWYHTQGVSVDFPHTESGDFFTGLDEGAFELRVQQLKDSGLFTQAFLDNYTKIGHEIHRRLRTKEMIYEAGYTPPYGNGANPWTNSLDVSSDTYWNEIRIENVVTRGNRAVLTWSWPGNYREMRITKAVCLQKAEKAVIIESADYQIEVVKENDRWKITRMQGFDFKTFFPQ